MKPILVAGVACICTVFLARLLVSLPQPTIDLSRETIPMRETFLLLGKGVAIVLGIMV